MMTPKKRRAFTLVELVVSLAITSVIAFFVFSFAASLADLWRNTEGGVDTELDAQIALDRIVMDLEAAIFQERQDPLGNAVPMFALSAIAKGDDDPYQVSFSNRWQDIDESARPAEWHFDPGQHRYGWAGSWLRFFTAAPSFNAVGYQVIRRPAFGDSSVDRYLLHRSLIRQDNTIAGGFDIVNGNYQDGTTANAIASPRLDSAILEDVVDFGLRLYVFDESMSGTDDSPRGLRLVFPADANGNLDINDKEHLGSTLTGNNFGSRYPEVAEVFLRVLDDVGADLLIRLEAGETVSDYNEIVEKHSRLYQRMVRLPGREPKGYTP
ncbi:prepilin-type N-terminal cleavage/methylation domain-containing protein [Pelagicoccus sp. NFK12]|uniref:Prepilin-type N-terminal cleavage/methylation domain-containing protein n=1 Tax=Pelagicoccus enzymogenes TaxID=2773457 RepID=A0A927F7J5_9BACT|nr:prepilin-type N-terminal cleavage/methylation domain-containing protein [Pelagicoccus enzymogenes]MBD5779707.1 prepilin-type N-terminal cleavage/methylation domain-containing protein [Pelagicoccus enzymogenes]